MSWLKKLISDLVFNFKMKRLLKKRLADIKKRDPFIYR